VEPDQNPGRLLKKTPGMHLESVSARLASSIRTGGGAVPVRVYIVEDHPVMREIIQDYLALNSELEICGMAGSAEEASMALGATAPDVVMVDLSLPGRSGLELVEEIRERWGTPCLILSGHGERTYVARAFACGARGYVLKGNPRDIPAAIQRVLAGEIHLSAELCQNLDYVVEDVGA
jgi:DNA-binding NarL/FixJ family response regulator